MNWVDVCPVARLLPERGVAALVDGEQVAVFLLHDGRVLGLDNLDPFSGAAVLSRGIVGDRGGEPTVASPVFKQVFSLLSGRCLDDPGVSVATRRVRTTDGVVQVGDTVSHDVTISAAALHAPVPPLAGYAVGVTAARRADELATMLERRGASVQHGPALRIVPLADDAELLTATRALVAAPPDITVATTGIGFRGWVEVADGWGLREDLVRVLGSGELIARGPKARGAIRASGLVDAWSPASESSAEVLSHLLERGVAGKRIAVQLHGEPQRDVVDALTAAGAEVVTVPVYRWVPPVDIAPLDRLTDAVLAGTIDVMAFTSAPAAASLLARAHERGVAEPLLTALRGPVLALCVGPVTAGPLHAVEIPTLQPDRSRLGAMVRRLEAEMPARVRRLQVAGHLLELRGRAVLVDGELRPVAPAGMALLRVLAGRSGQVVTRAVLLRALPGSSNDEHAVETAMTRLRAALGDGALVQTVVKRGYRLAVEVA